MKAGSTTNKNNNVHTLAWHAKNTLHVPSSYYAVQLPKVPGTGELGSTTKQVSGTTLHYNCPRIKAPLSEVLHLKHLCATCVLQVVLPSISVDSHCDAYRQAHECVI